MITDTSQIAPAFLSRVIAVQEALRNGGSLSQVGYIWFNGPGDKPNAEPGSFWSKQTEQKNGIQNLMKLAHVAIAY